MRGSAQSVLLIVLAAIGSRASAGTQRFDLPPCRDNTIYEEGVNRSNGRGDLFAGRTATDNERRALLAFDLGGIPNGSVVASAALTVTVDRTRSGDVNFGLHALRASWGEGNSLATGQGGQGAAAAPGDVTWLHRFFTEVLWQTPGGDFDPEPVVETVLGPVGDYSFASTPALVALVQSWLDQPASNHGVIIVRLPPSGGTAKRLLSREHPDSPPILSLTVMDGDVIFRSGFEQ